MTPQDLRLVIKNAQSGDTEAFIAFVSLLQRDLRVLVASFASSVLMVDTIIVETWSDCRIHLDQCPTSMAAFAWLRVTACKHLVHHLEAELETAKTSKDTLQLLIVPQALEHFNQSPTPSNSQGNKVHEKFQALDESTRALLTQRYVHRLGLEACVAELGGSATTASVARALFIARHQLDWRDVDHVSFAHADGKFAVLIEEFLNGAISPSSHERLGAMVLQDRILATQFERQVRIDLLLSALLAGASLDDARRLVSRLTPGPSAYQAPDTEHSRADSPSHGRTPRTAPMVPNADPSTDAILRSRHRMSYVPFWIGGALIVIGVVAYGMHSTSAVDAPVPQPASEPSKPLEPPTAIAEPPANTISTRMIAPGGSFAVKIHFQPDGAPVPAGYLKDDGALFGPKPSGFTYGWNIVHTDFTRQRNHNPDPRLDSFCHFHAGGKWELEVPNGSYVVTISIGEPDNPSTNTLIVDGIEFCRHVNLPTNTFSRMVKTVPVTAGRLTVSQGSEPDKTTRIDYIEVVSAGTVDAGIGSH